MKKTIIIEFYKDKSKKWRFRLKSSNGRILASSEAYSSKTKCVNGAKACVDFGQVDYRWV